MEALMSALPKLQIMEKTVFVHSYMRRRYGKWETVVSHHRRWPRT